jgi:hypothetical protein
MITAIQVKSEAPDVADPKDVRAGIAAAIIAILILFIILFLYTFEMLDPPPADVVVKTETTLEEIELKELVIEPGGGGSTSPTDAAPSPTDAQQVLTGNNSTSTTQTGKPNGTGTGDNPFGNGGFGGKGTGGFGPATGPDENNDGDGTTCSTTPTNLNSIINQLKNTVIVTKPTSATVTIKIKSDGSVSSVTVTGLGGSAASVEKKIKEVISKSTCTPCNGKNKNSRSYTFDKIVLKQD